MLARAAAPLALLAFASASSDIGKHITAWTGTSSVLSWEYESVDFFATPQDCEANEYSVAAVGRPSDSKVSYCESTWPTQATMCDDLVAVEHGGVSKAVVWDWSRDCSEVKSKMVYDDAAAECNEQGMRICTSDELPSNWDTPCGLNWARGWTSSPCGTIEGVDAFFAANFYYDSSEYDELSTNCIAKDHLMRFRCCQAESASSPLNQCYSCPAYSTASSGANGADTQDQCVCDNGRMYGSFGPCTAPTANPTAAPTEAPSHTRRLYM